MTMDEDEHVHKVYEEIAQHFSNTRYKASYFIHSQQISFTLFYSLGPW
jgi:hypothetical protein